VVPVCDVAEQLTGKKLDDTEILSGGDTAAGRGARLVALPVSGECELDLRRIDACERV